MIVYSKCLDGYHAINFHDVDLGRTIVRVHGAVRLLFMGPSKDSCPKKDICIFEKISLEIDFAQARQQPKTYEIRPFEDAKDYKVFKHHYSHDWREEMIEVRDWRKKGSEGFTTYCQGQNL